MSGGFCVDCGHCVESFDGLKCCPACGSTGIPCANQDQVAVSVNWQELRVLVIWAENHARLHADKAPWMPKTVTAIARRLEDQHPDRALGLPLTLAGELRQLRDSFPQAQIFPKDLERAVDEHAAINDPPPEDRTGDA